MIDIEAKDGLDPCVILPSEDGKRVSSNGTVIIKNGDTTSVDVRGLEPPQPLVDILQFLESPDVTPTVIILHDRDPLLLYAELEERNWSWDEIPAPAGEMYFRLTRNTGLEG